MSSSFALLVDIYKKNDREREGGVKACCAERERGKDVHSPRGFYAGLVENEGFAQTFFGGRRDDVGSCGRGSKDRFKRVFRRMSVVYQKVWNVGADWVCSWRRGWSVGPKEGRLSIIVDVARLSGRSGVVGR